MKFSERNKLKKINTKIQIGKISYKLRSSLWNVLIKWFWKINLNHANESWSSYTQDFRNHIFKNYFQVPIDRQPKDMIEFFRNYFFAAYWYEIYDLIEAILEFQNNNILQNEINDVLKQHLSAYRFVNKICANIIEPQQIEMLEEALNDTDFPGVKEHLRTALELMSKKKKPDYRNSIKESISAVESISQIITKNPKATLGDALKVIEKKNKLHSALKQGFTSIYGYTSDADGIRHAMLNETKLNADDAKYFLLSCTSFINYLKTKM